MTPPPRTRISLNPTLIPTLHQPTIPLKASNNRESSLPLDNAFSFQLAPISFRNHARLFCNDNRPIRKNNITMNLPTYIYQREIKSRHSAPSRSVNAGGSCAYPHTSTALALILVRHIRARAWGVPLLAHSAALASASGAAGEPLLLSPAPFINFVLTILPFSLSALTTITHTQCAPPKKSGGPQERETETGAGILESRERRPVKIYNIL